MNINDKGQGSYTGVRSDNVFFKPVYNHIMYDSSQQYPAPQAPVQQQQAVVQAHQQYQGQQSQPQYQQQNHGSPGVQTVSHNDRSAYGKEYDQPRYYTSQMVIQQPSSVQVSTGSQYTLNQSFVYSGQQPVYETIPVNNYLLVPNNGTGYTQTATENTSNSSGFTNSNYSGANASSNHYGLYFANFIERLQGVLPSPPLARAETRQELNLNINQKRAKRKSKFTKKQDEMIVMLKKKGKSWVEIAEIVGVGSYLAARNRYQVIVGQQGNYNSSSWVNGDKELLQSLLDDAEIDKWRFIAAELNKATNKDFTDKECRDMIRSSFWANPTSYGVTEETINECLKEKKITEKINEQCRRSYSESLYANSVASSDDSNHKRDVSHVGYFHENQPQEYRSSSESIEDNEYGKIYY